MLYKSTDIGQACTITSLAYNCVTTYLYGNDDLGGLNADIKIYLAEVTKSELSQNEFTPEEDLTLVCEGTNIALGDDEWETFNFSNPFVYSGNNNLVVVVSKSATTNAQNIRWASGIRAKSVLFDFSDNNPAGAEFPSSESALGGAGYLYHMLPNMKFGINGGSTPDPTVPAAPANFNATATGQTTIDLTWNAVTGAASYNVYNGTTSIANDDEKPVHSVTLSDYYIGETEVTQELWQAVMGSNPSYFSGYPQRPVEYVSWNDCQEFITKLNELTGKNFRLPTEAEWEYAARGGNKSQRYKYSGSNTIGNVAWYDDNSSSRTHDVKTKQANELGIYDMSGNVLEWCQDWYGSYSSGSQTNPTGPSSGSLRVIRGGYWGAGTGVCRVTYHGSNYPDDWSSGNCYGFRLALSQ